MRLHVCRGRSQAGEAWAHPCTARLLPVASCQMVIVVGVVPSPTWRHLEMILAATALCPSSDDTGLGCSLTSVLAWAQSETAPEWYGCAVRMYIDFGRRITREE